MSTETPRVFISYRRADSQDFTERMHDRLVRELGKDNVFLDVDNNIPVGSVFSDVLVNALDKSDIVLVIIGQLWLDIREEGDRSKRRLNNPEDWVRKEVATALKTRNVSVIPVLIHGATMPAVKSLPFDMRRLTTLQAAIVRRNPHFHTNMTTLIEEMHKQAIEARQRTESPELLDANGNQDGMIDIYDANQTLMQYGGYTDEDLIANRNGQVTEAQLAAIKKPQIDWKGFLWRIFLAFAIGIVLSLIFIGLQSVIPQIPFTFGPLFVMIIEIILLYFAYIEYIKDDSFEIYIIEGIIKTAYKRYKRTTYLLLADGREVRFELDDTRADLLVETLEQLAGYRARIYRKGYAEALSLEIVEDSES